MTINPTDNNPVILQTNRLTSPVEGNGADQQPSPGNTEASANGAAIMSVQATKDVINSLGGYMEALQTSLSFSISQDTDRIIVTIKNKETNEVIRQIPPEELVALQEKMKELTGLIFNEVA